MIFNNIPIGVIRRRRAQKTGRPMLRPEMAAPDWLLEALALLGLMVIVGYAIYQYPRLPGTIPSHFNGSGIPDDYSGKASIWFLPAISGFIYVMLSLIVLIPHQFNYAVRITPENALKQYAMAIRLVRYLKTMVIWLFFYITHATVQVAAGKESGLGPWLIPVLFGVILIPLVIYFILAFRNR